MVKKNQQSLQERKLQRLFRVQLSVFVRNGSGGESSIVLFIIYKGDIQNGLSGEFYTERAFF